MGWHVPVKTGGWIGAIHSLQAPRIGILGCLLIPGLWILASVPLLLDNKHAGGCRLRQGQACYMCHWPDYKLTAPRPPHWQPSWNIRTGISPAHINGPAVLDIVTVRWAGASVNIAT
ncbi:hypothetical protein BDW68DRAFT_111574 [Aspergillus falconensis]